MAINFLNNSNLPDNAKLTFGDSDDLEIYHDASGGNSYISEVGTGNLYIQSDGQIRLDNPTDGEKMARFYSGAVTNGVELFHDNAIKIATISTGVDITGGFTTSSSSSCAGLNMTADIAMGSKNITDSNSSAGSAGQILSSLGAGNGVDWIDNDGAGTVTSIATSAPITGGTITTTGTIGISNATGTTVGAAAIQAGTGISVSDSSGVYTITNSSPSSGGTVTSVAVTVGTGLDVSGSPITGSGTIDIDLDLTELTLGAGIDSTATGLSLDLSEFTDMTADMTGTDEFIVLDSSAERRKAANEIGLSIFDNDAGFTTNSGTVTSIATTSPIEGGTITGSGTISHASFTDTETTSSETLTSADTFTAYTSVTTNATGHVTGHNLKTYTLPTSTNNDGTVTSVTLAAGTGISLSGTNPITSTGTITVTNTAPNVAETFTGWVIRDDDGDDKTLSGSTNKYLKVTMANGTAGTNLSGTGTTGDPYVLALTSPGDSGLMTWKIGSTTGTDQTVSDGQTVDVVGGTGISGTIGGTRTVTLDLDDTAVSAGSYTNASITVDAQGRLTAASSGSDAQGVTSITFDSDSGSTTAITSTGTIDIAGGTNVTTSATGSTVTINSSDQYTGTVTSVELTGGEGVDVAVTSGANPITSSGNLTLTLDLDELTTTTGSGNADFFPIVNSSGAQYKIAPSDIDLSTMNNDSGWTANAGTVTSVGITAGTGISVSGSPVTGSGSITVTNTAPATIDGSGAANQVAYWSDSDTLTGSNDLTYNGTTLALAGDNEVLQIGTGGTGTTSLFAWTGSTFYIQQDSASGAIQVETDNFLVKNHGAGETYIEATDNGSVDLYHNNVKTFETTAAGATVTGDISITGGDITTNGVQTFSNSSSADALLIGDTTGGDTVSTIDLWVMGASQAQVEDGAFKIQNNCTLQLNSGSDIALNGDSNIRLDASIAANQSSGIVLPLGSTSVTVNNVYYWKASSAWELTDADTEAKTNGLLAYANSSGTASSNRMVLKGIVFDSGHGFTIGAPLYIHTTAGALSNTAPSGTADCVRVVGYAITSDEIYFCPDNTWVKVS